MEGRWAEIWKVEAGKADLEAQDERFRAEVENCKKEKWKLEQQVTKRTR